MAEPRRMLDPADAVMVGDTTILPDRVLPVAAVVTGESGQSVRWLTWPDAPLPDIAFGDVLVWGTPSGAWVVYRAGDVEELPQHTAVHLTPTAVTAAVDLGTSRPVGADESGLLVVDEADARRWSADDGERADALDELANLDPDTLPWAPAEPFWPERAGWTEQSEGENDIDIDIDGLSFMGATRFATFGDLLQENDADADAVRPQPQRQPEPEPIQPVRPALITTDGTRVELESTAVAPLLDGGPEDWERDFIRRQAIRAEWADRLEVPDLSGTHWSLGRVDDATRDRAVAELRRQLESLDAPSLEWTSDHPSYRRARSDYRNVELSVEGDWPETSVIVTFEHATVPFLRLRRRYRVFDDAGHPRDWRYVAVYLREDVDTHDIPPRSAAVDGILDI